MTNNLSKSGAASQSERGILVGTSGGRRCWQRHVRGDRAAQRDGRRLDAQLGSVLSNAPADQIAKPGLLTGQMQLTAPICEPARCN